MIKWQDEFGRMLLSRPQLQALSTPLSSDGLVLYGAGSMGRMAENLLSSISVKPKYFVDMHGRGEIGGIRVITPEQIPGCDLIRLTFVVCVVSAPVEPIFSFLRKRGCADVRHFYDLSEICLKDRMSNGWLLPDPEKRDREGIESVFSAIEHDETSVAHYLQFLWWRLRRREVLYNEFPVLSSRKYFDAPCFPLMTGHERLVDGGAHYGDVIVKFSDATEGRFDSVWAFEPDEGNMSVLRRSVPPDLLHRTRMHAEALSDHDGPVSFFAGLGYASKVKDGAHDQARAVRLDSIADIRPTIIKLHLEGHELEALQGAAETIRINRPILMVLADHSPDGLYRTAQFLINLTGYRLFFYVHDFCGNSAIYYCIPAERKYD